MYDTDEIRAFLHRSLDRKVYLRSLLGVLLAVPVGLLYSRIRHPDMGLRLLLTLAPVLAIFTAAWGLRLLRLYRKLDSYIIVKATLGRAGIRYSKGSVSLPVSISDPTWGVINARTNRIFHCRGFTQPLLADYENRTVTVAYNLETKVLAVIE